MVKFEGTDSPLTTLKMTPPRRRSCIPFKRENRKIPPPPPPRFRPLDGSELLKRELDLRWANPKRQRFGDAEVLD